MRIHGLGRALTWAGIVASSVATIVLALPTWRHWWFSDSPRTEDSTLESWANPALIDLGNWLTLLPLLAFLAALASAGAGALALRRPWLGLLGAGTCLVSMLSMLLGWALLAGHTAAAAGALAALLVAGGALFTASLLQVAASSRARVAHQSCTDPSRRRFTGR